MSIIGKTCIVRTRTAGVFLGTVAKRELALVQELIGPSAYLFRDRKTGARYSLRDLPPNNGRYQDEPNIECGVLCELAERDLTTADCDYLSDHRVPEN